MSKVIEYEKFVADFETTVYEGQESTEVWAAAWISLDMPTDEKYVTVNLSLDNFMSSIFNIGGNKKMYFHNLKFDGSFIIPWLYDNGFKLWSYGDGSKEKLFDESISKMPAKYFTCLIDDMGQWYSITVKWKHKIVTFVDSLKLLPFSVEAIGKAFDTKYRKSSIEYTGRRVPGSSISKEEEDYIKKDVLVMQEAMNKLFDMTGEEKMTIGSLCMSEFAKTCFHDEEEMKAILPDLTKINCPFDGFSNADGYIRKSYHGGWCYVKEGKENTKNTPQIIRNGCTADVNSLYPSMMHSESGNYYPYGTPKFFIGDIPKEVLEKSSKNELYFFVRIRTQFNLKKNFLPTIQIKGNPMYPARKWLTTSNVNGSNIYIDIDGKVQKTEVELVLTQTDYKLLKDHYDLIDEKIIDGCYFRTVKGLFDPYIDKWAEIKRTSKGALRTLSKLFLNNLYGKLATSINSSYKIPYMEDGVLKCKIVEEYNKKSGYIAMGAAITSYARNFTIRHAQANYKHFIYADTDSIHCDCKPRYLKDIRIHPTAFNAWKIENEWDAAVFARAKTYIEHTIIEDGQKCEPYYMIKCAGMGKNAKKKLENKLLDNEITLEDFRTGLVVSGNLKAIHIVGGTVLVDNDYIMR